MRDHGHRGVFAWMLFDWANQPFQTLIVTFVFAPYFASAVAGNAVEGQALWGAGVAVAGGLTALLAPVLGAIADRSGARKPWILAFSLPYLIGSAGLWWARPGMAAPESVLLLFGLAFIGSELSQVFVNAMLPGLGPRAETGRISGSGWALGYAGGLVSLALMLALIVPAPGSELTLLGLAPILGLDPAQGEPARASGPFTVIWFLLFAWPMLLFTPDTPRRGHLGRALRAGLSDLAATFLRVRAHRRLFTYLVASMLYRDGLVALFTFGGIYAAGILGWGTFELGVFGIVAAAVGALGAFLGGRADSAFGPRPVIVASIWTLILVCLVTLTTTRASVGFLPVAPDSRLPDLVFLCAGGLLGAASGALQAASRTLLIDEAEGHVDSTQAFGLYALSGRATAFIGPGLIAAATALTGSQRLGIGPVIVLFAAGLLLLSSMRADPERTQRMESGTG